MPSVPSSSFLPLVAYAEALCVSARVLLVGDARSEIAVRLLERGARLVHVCDEVPARRAEGAQRTVDRAITFGALNDGSFALREGFFDLALVENLASHADPKAVLTSLSRLLAPRGSALIAAPNPESRRSLLASGPRPDNGGPSAGRALDYYALYDAVAAAFPRVRMLGQVPFVGYAVVDFASEGEPEVVFDTSLVPGAGEEPEFFVAVAGEQRVPVDSYVVVQLPSASLLEAGREKTAEPPLEAPLALREKPSERPPEKAQEKPLVDDSALRRQEAWIAELEARAVAADERADAAESELDELRERHGNLEQRGRHEVELLHGERDSLKTELDRQQRNKHDLGELLQTAQTQVATLQAQAQARETQVQTLQTQFQARETQIQTLQSQAQARETQVQTLEAQLRTLEAEAAALNQKVAAVAEDGAAVAELQQLEAQLTERGERIRGLERELREAERTGRELVRRLERSSAIVAPQPRPAEPPAATPAPAPTASAERVAELEAERMVLTWALAIARGEMPAGAATALPPLPVSGDFSG